MVCVLGLAQVLLLLAVDVLEHCVASVRQLKGITATYRMTAKGPPVRHSHYVAGATLQKLSDRQRTEDWPRKTVLVVHLKLSVAAVRHTQPVASDNAMGLSSWPLCQVPSVL